jgi:6-phosphogluconolactonase
VLLLASCASNREIVSFALDREHGALRRLGSIVLPGNGPCESSMPLAVSPDRRHVYVSVRSEPFYVAQLALDGPRGRLELVSRTDYPFSACYIRVDPAGRFLLTASLPHSTIAVNPLDRQSGAAGPCSQIISDVAKAHCIVLTPDWTRAYVAELGNDRIRQMRFDGASGRLSDDEPPATPTRRGAGPRHLAFHPKAPYLYCVNETDGTVDAYAYAATGGLRAVGSASLATPGAGNNRAADIHVSPDGQHLYASERLRHTIAVFALGPEGAPSALGSCVSEQEPRSFQIDPSGRWLVAAGYVSGGVSVNAVDRATGALRTVASHEAGPGASWVELLDFHPH